RQLHIEVGRFGAREPFSELVILGCADLLVAQAQPVRFGANASGPLVTRFARPGRRWRAQVDGRIGRRRFRDCLVYALGHDEHGFETTLEARGLDQNLLVRIPSTCYAHLAYREAFWKYPVIAGSVKPLANRDLFFVGNVVDLACGVALAFERADYA